jgi:hypothetical protein
MYLHKECPIFVLKGCSCVWGHPLKSIFLSTPSFEDHWRISGVGFLFSNPDFVELLK